MAAVDLDGWWLGRAGELLRAEEEVELGAAIEAGLYAGRLLAAGGVDAAAAVELAEVAEAGREAFGRFVAGNVRLAAWWARRLAACGVADGVTVEDLTSEGVLGVIRAVQKWDYRRGLKFSTYAVYWVRQFQQRLIVRSRAVTLTYAEDEDCRQLVQAEADLAQQLQRTPSDGELAAELGTTRRRVQQLRRMLARPASLDAPIDAAGMTPLGALLADAGTGEPAAADVHGLLGRLDPRQRGVVEDLFGLVDGVPRSVDDVARLRRVPARLVADTAAAALRQLRAAAAHDSSAAGVAA